eukprot:634822-Pyramimonas_sp.AAC.1
MHRARCGNELRFVVGVVGERWAVRSSQLRVQRQCAVGDMHVPKRIAAEWWDAARSSRAATCAQRRAPAIS